MVLAELQMDIACPDECFQAINPEDCFHKVQLWATSLACPGNFSVQNLVHKLCSFSATAHLIQEIGHLSALNMFVLITGKLLDTQKN